MTREEVQKKLEQFLSYLREEDELRNELSSLQFTADSEEEIEKTLQIQDEIMEELEKLHKEKMLPLLNELGEFIERRLKESKEREEQ